MLVMRPAAILIILGVMIFAVAGPAAAGTVVISSGQFAPFTKKPHFKLYSVGEGVEWVAGESTVWAAGVDLPPRALMTSMVVYCLDNVEPDAVVRLYKVKGDGSPPQEIEVVVTGGTRDEPGTGYMSNAGLRDEPRVNRGVYHYFVKITMPPRPDDVRGILRVNAVEVAYEK